MDHSHDWIFFSVAFICAMIVIVSVLHGDNVCRMILWYLDERNKLKRMEIERKYPDKKV